MDLHVYSHPIRFFPEETVHTLRGKFLDFFNRNEDLVLVLVPN